MQVKVPVNYRQSFKWVGNLDASSLLLVGAGGVLAFRVLTSHVPWGIKVPSMVLSVGVGAALGLARWPIEHGDGAFEWGRRLAEYRGRSRRASLFRVIGAAEASRRERAYDMEDRGDSGAGTSKARGEARAQGRA